MLSREMNKKKWVRLLVVILAVLLTVIAVSALSSFLFYQWLDSIPTAMEISSDNEYYQKMLLLQETSDTAKVGDIFDFDFDEAYVASRPYGDGTSYLDKLGVETAVPLPSYDTGGHYRILFIKTNQQKEIAQLMLNYNTANPVSPAWNRTLDSLVLEWEIHNNVYGTGFFQINTKDCDFNNGDEGKGYWDFFQERVLK